MSCKCRYGIYVHNSHLHGIRSLLVAERGVVCELVFYGLLKFGVKPICLVFRKQEINIHEQLDLARHFGPLHKHPTTPVPREPGLEEVHSE